MKDWKEILISDDKSIRDVIQVIDQGALQVALVVDGDNRLLGIVTDGDIRRGILKGISLDDPITQIMNTSPTVARIDDDRTDILALLKRKSFHQVPIVDHDHRLVGLEIIENLISHTIRENVAVIMAGGLGSRLRPMTDDCPKPLLRVAGKPILETILEQLIEHGFHKFFFSVNYKAEMIQEYFGDGGKYDCTIDYLLEREPLGTAGALSLLPVVPEHPFLVMNGDVLTKVDVKHLFHFHESNGAEATMCIREYGLQVPYGVVQVNQHRLKKLEEKPVHKFFVNAGIYVLHPDILRRISPKHRLDMTTLFNQLIQDGHQTSVFPIREYWIDLGQTEDFRKAQNDYGTLFR